MIDTWITGARGFIGRHLARRLGGAGAEVAGLGHGAWPDAEARRWGVRSWLNGDVSLANLERLARLHGPPARIFHLAGGSSVGLSIQTPMEDFHRTVETTLQLLEWARSHARHACIALASSAAVYGDGRTGPIRETDPVAPLSPYGSHKRIAEILMESYARQYGARVAIVRLFSVCGPGLEKQLLWDLCTRLRANPDRVELGGDGGERRDWLHVEDAAAALVAAADRASPEPLVVNGGTGVGATVLEVAREAVDAWGSAARIVFAGTPRPGDPRSLVADTRRAEELGIRAGRDWRASVREYVAWFRGLDP